jgi:hypothetical protein
MNVRMVSSTQLPNPVNKLEIHEVNSLSSILSRTLHDEPHLVYLFPEQEMRRNAARRFFEAAIHASELWGEICTHGTANGAALWLRPEYNWTIGEILRSGMIGIPFKLEPGVLRRCLKLGAGLAKVRKRLAPASHWYLMVLGAGTSDHEETIGGALIEPVLSRADSTGLPCYLETFNEKRLRFYKNHGFRITGAGKIPDGGPAFWAMRRPAKVRIG